MLSNAKYRYLPARSEADQERNEINVQGPASGGKDAVYVGFDLEQAQRSAMRAGALTKLPNREWREFQKISNIFG